MSDINKINQHGEHSIGVVQDNAIGIFSPTYILTNPDLNKIPFTLPEEGIFFYSYRYPQLHSFFKNRILYYFLIIVATLILILPLFKLKTHHDAIIILISFVSYIVLMVIQKKIQKNFLKKDGILLDQKNPILFQNIRKIKKEDLILKIYLQQKVYPEYNISLRNEDQIDAIIECFQYWLSSKNKK